MFNNWDKRSPRWNKKYLDQFNTHPIVNSGEFGVLKDDVIKITEDKKYHDLIDKILDYSYNETQPLKGTKNYTRTDFDEVLKMMNEVLFVYQMKLKHDMINDDF